MSRDNLISRKTFIYGAFGAGCFIATATLMPRVSQAQMEKIKLSMTALQAKTAKLGEPRIEGTDPVAGKNVPALYFGKTRFSPQDDYYFAEIDLDQGSYLVV